MYSHPNIKLMDHLNSVKEIGLKVFYEKKGLKLIFDIDKIKAALENMLFFHDFGKASKYFQEYLNQSVKEQVITVDKKLRNHALISAVYSAYLTYIDTDNKILSMIVFETVKKHHGNIENIYEELVISPNKWRILKEQFESIDLGYFNKNNVSFEELEEFFLDVISDIDIDDFKSEYFYLLNFFFSVLTYSDKTEAIFHKKNITKSIPENIDTFIDNYKKVKFENNQNSELNLLREDIYNLIESKFIDAVNDKKIISIDVPTGSGKTLSVLNIVFKALKNNDNVKRIIYALPFTSIVDQTEEIIGEIFKINNYDADDYLTVHHHLVETGYKIENDESFEGEKALFLIENWDKPIILTTFWQIFNSILTNKNKQLRKFHNLANSFIIFDEIQALPYRYWGVIKEILTKLTKLLNCRIILMTATMPLIFSEAKKEIFPLVDFNNRKKYFNKFSRYGLNVINNLNNLNINELSKIAIDHIRKSSDKSFLFVFNTIKSSLLFYKILKDIFNDENLIYLSTNIIPSDRRKRIEKIKSRKGRKIVISTQLIEAGVDIDLDIVYRDFAPLDNIVQTAGRCNRNNKKEGEVFVFSLKKDNSVNRDSSYIYSKSNLIPTKNIFLEKNFFLESELLNIIKKYYMEVNKILSCNDSLKLKDDIMKLNYQNIYDNFKLIKEMPSVVVFVEKDKKAEDILKKFIALGEIEDKFERKNKFLKFRKDFYDYTISVKISADKVNDIKNFEEIGFLKVITKDMLDFYYKDDTGFNSEFEEQFF